MKKELQIISEWFRNQIRGELVKKYHISTLLLKALSSVQHSKFNIPDEAKWNTIINSYYKGEALENAFRCLEEHNEYFDQVFSDIDFSTISEDNLENFLALIDSYSEDFPNIAKALLDLYIQKEGIRSDLYKENDNLIDLLVSLLNIEKGVIYDGAAGTNSFLIEVYRRSKSKGLKLYAQEVNPFTWSMGKIMFAINDLNDEIVTSVNSNTLMQPLIVDNEIQKFDGIISDAPFGLKNWGEELAHSDPYRRYKYGVPPKSSADWAFISHNIASLKETGKAVLIVPQGVLFRGAKEGKIREAVIEDDLIEAVIGLPANILAETAVPVAVLIINKNKQESLRNRVLIINAEESFERQRNKNVLLEEHVDKIVSTYQDKVENDGFSILATKEQVRENEYNLLPLKYFSKVEVETELGLFKFDKANYENVETLELGQFTSTQRGLNIVAKEENTESNIFLINLSDVNDDEINFESLKKVEISPKQEQDYLLQKGDILISSRGTKNTKIIVIPDTEKQLVFSSNFVRVRINNLNHWHPYYIKLFLDSPVGQFFIKASQTGSMVSVLSAKDIEKISVPIKTYIEQEKIANRFLEAQMHYQLELLALEQKKAALMLETYTDMGLNNSFRIGSGKTRSIIKLIENVLYKNYELVVLITENKSDLVKQAISRIAEHLSATNLSNRLAVQDLKGISQNQVISNGKVVVVVPGSERNIEELEEVLKRPDLNQKKMLIIHDKPYSYISLIRNFEYLELEKNLKELAVKLGDASYVPATTALYL